MKTHGPSLSVFIVCAYGDANAVATALARVASEFLTKPVDIMVVKADAMRRNT